MAGASLVIFVLLAVLVARGYARSSPPGHEITSHDRIIVALTVFAVGGLAIGATVVFSFKFAPDVTSLDRALRGLTVVGIGVAPLMVFLLITWVLRATRNCENAWRTRHSS